MVVDRACTGTIVRHGIDGFVTAMMQALLPEFLEFSVGRCACADGVGVVLVVCKQLLHVYTRGVSPSGCMN